jgi:hypothetical protein
MSNTEDYTSDNDVQETSSSSPVKRRISGIYQYFTFGNDGRWHCNHCTQVIYFYFYFSLFISILFIFLFIVLYLNLFITVLL